MRLEPQGSPGILVLTWDSNKSNQIPKELCINNVFFTCLRVRFVFSFNVPPYGLSRKCQAQTDPTSPRSGQLRPVPTASYDESEDK